MSFCPICNGLSTWNAACPQCGQALYDEGPLQNFLGPYSPYRNIDDMKMSNEYPDLELHQCIHIGTCPQCQQQMAIAVSEWSEG